MSKIEFKKFEEQNISIANIPRLDYLKSNVVFLLSISFTPVIGIYYYLGDIPTNITIILSTIMIIILSLGFGKSDNGLEEEDLVGITDNTKYQMETVYDNKGTSKGKKFILDENGKKIENKFLVHMGYIVKEHTKEGAGADFKKKGNIIAPILLDRGLYATHGNVVGTTGSGKTVMVKSLMRQLVMDVGTGFIMIEGKGDNGMLHEINAEMILAKKEHDFYVLNFLNKNNSNTLNPLEIGDFDGVKDLLLDFINSGSGDTWEQGGMELLESVLRVLIYLRDSNLVWNPKHTKEINTVEDIETYKDTASIPVLKDIVNSPSEIFEFSLAISRLYNNDRVEFEKRLITNNIRKEESEFFHEEADKIVIHEGLIDVLIRQGNGIPDWNTCLQLGSFPNILESIEAKDPMYKIGISSGFYGKMFQTFIGQYGEIFAVREGDINLEDIMNNGKVLHVLLQGINPTTSSAIGKFMVSLIRMVAKKRALENPYVFPYTIFLDEFNSWSKGVEGFADLMSVTRSYGLTFFPMHQSSLSKIDDGKGIEKEQIEANENMEFYLKVQDRTIAKELIEGLPKKMVIRKKLKLTTKDLEKDGYDVDYDEKEEDYCKPEDLVNLQSGQGYVKINGKVNKFISTYIEDNTRWEMDQRKPVLINKLVKDDLFITSIRY